MFAELQFKRFLEDISARTPTPGGGTVSVATSLLGSALGIMAANFSDSESAKKTIIALKSIQSTLLPLLDKDAEAYDKVSISYKLPKSTEEEKRHRTSTIQTALKSAAEVPLTAMRFSLDAIKIINEFAPFCNKNLSSDIGSAALLLTAGLKGCALNVSINAKSIKDGKKREELESSADSIVKEAEGLQTKILKELSIRC